MRKIFALIPVFVFAVLGTLSCDDEKESLKEDAQAKGPQVVTLDAEKITFCVASLSGRVSGLEGVALDFECGIEYSTDKDFSNKYTIRQKVDKRYTEDSYSITVLGIQPGKEYYYRAYYISQQLIYYGEVKTFTFEWTAPAVTTLGAELDSGVVVIKGLVKDKGALVEELSEYYPCDYYGIAYSTTETFEFDSTTFFFAYRGLDNMDDDSMICTIDDFKYFTTYYYRAFFWLEGIQSYGEVKTFRFEWDGPEMVDLGLSVKWATCNVGATYPADLGDYFAWGETEPKTDYTLYTCRYFDGTDNWTKYNTNSGVVPVDNKTILDPEDDAAYVNCGGSWRMPTLTEMEELRDSCTWIWSTQNGERGYLVISNKTGYEGASIFLPAAGYRNGTDLNNVGSVGDYWSSSLHTGDQGNACYFKFGMSIRYTFYDSRSIGRSVRPVCP